MILPARNYKPPFLSGISHCHVWWPEGNYQTLWFFTIRGISPLNHGFWGFQTIAKQLVSILRDLGDNLAFQLYHSTLTSQTSSPKACEVSRRLFSDFHPEIHTVGNKNQQQIQICRWGFLNNPLDELLMIMRYFIFCNPVDGKCLIKRLSNKDMSDQENYME